MSEYPELKLELNENRVYVVLDDPPTSSGIIQLAEKQSLPSRIGTVRAVGPEVKNYRAGDRILLSSYSGINLYLWQYGMKDERHRILAETEILAKVLN